MSSTTIVSLKWSMKTPTPCQTRSIAPAFCNVSQICSRSCLRVRTGPACASGPCRRSGSAVEARLTSRRSPVRAGPGYRRALLEHVHVSAGPFDRAVDRSMRSKHDEQPLGGPTDDLEARLEIRQAPGIVAGLEELPEAVVGCHLWSGVPPTCRANPSCNQRAPGATLDALRPSVPKASCHAAVAAVSRRLSARRSSRDTCICE